MWRTLLLVALLSLPWCGTREQSTAPPHELKASFDPSLSPEQLIGRWEGPRGVLEFDGERARIVEYACGPRPGSPQFSEDGASCPPHEWSFDYEVRERAIRLIYHNEPGAWVSFVLNASMSPEGRLHLDNAPFFGVMTSRVGRVDFRLNEALELREDDCTFIDLHGHRRSGECRWREESGRQHLTFHHQPGGESWSRWEMVYLEDRGLLVSRDHLETSFERVAGPTPDLRPGDEKEPGRDEAEVGGDGAPELGASAGGEDLPRGDGAVAAPHADGATPVDDP